MGAHCIIYYIVYYLPVNPNLLLLQVNIMLRKVKYVLCITLVLLAMCWAHKTRHEDHLFREEHSSEHDVNVLGKEVSTFYSIQP